MGSLCSKAGTHSEDGGPPRAISASRRPRKSGQTLGESAASEARPSDPRAAAAQAAEERLNAVRTGDTRIP